MNEPLIESLEATVRRIVQEMPALKRELSGHSPGIPEENWDERRWHTISAAYMETENYVAAAHVRREDTTGKNEFGTFTTVTNYYAQLHYAPRSTAPQHRKPQYISLRPLTDALHEEIAAMRQFNGDGSRNRLMEIGVELQQTMDGYTPQDSCIFRLLPRMSSKPLDGTYAMILSFAFDELDRQASDIYIALNKQEHNDKLPIRIRSMAYDLKKELDRAQRGVQYSTINNRDTRMQAYRDAVQHSSAFIKESASARG